MLIDRIRTALARRPWWGAETLARKFRTTPRTIRTTASKHAVALMTRYEVEAELDQLVEALERATRDDGQAEQ